MSMQDDTQHVSADPEIIDRDDVRLSVMEKAKRLFARLPFVRHVVAMVYAVRDPETPFWSKAILAGALMYFLMPLDLIPDFIAGVGFTDDAAVVATALKAVSTIMLPRHYEAAEAFLRGDISAADS